MAENIPAEADLKLSWRLPPEVLCLVFAELQCLWRADPAGPCGGMGMIEVSQVSRFWRSVVLNESSLWSSGVEACKLPAPWTPLIIKRTNDHLLDLQFSLVSNAYADDAFWLWFSYYASTRMRSLDFTCEGYHASRCVTRELKPFLSNLRHIRLHALMDPEPLYDDEATPKQEIFKLVSLRGAPELRTVDLLNFVLPWTPSIFSRVTNLKIVLDTYLDPDEHDWRPPKLSVFKSTLESMDSLEVLHLGDVFPAYMGRIPDTKLILPQSCRSVTVQNLWSDEDCAAFLSSLVIPETASVALVVRDGEALLDLATKSSHFVERPRAARFTFAIEDEDAGAVTFFPDIRTPPAAPIYTSHLSTTTRTFTLRARLERPFLVGVSRYGMDPRKADKQRNEALSEFIEAISDTTRMHVDELVYLHIAKLAPSVMDSVTGILRRAGNVHTLVLGKEAVNAALDILHPARGELASDLNACADTGEALLLPSLARVVLDVQNGDSADAKTLQRLVAFLEARRVRGDTLQLYLPRDLSEQQEISSLGPVLQPYYLDVGPRDNE